MSQENLTDNLSSPVFEMALSDSHIYQSFNNHAQMSSIIIEGIRTGTILTKEYIDEQIMQIQRTHISPLADRVIQAFNDGDILLIEAKNTVKVPIALPFFVTKLSGKVKGIIFTNNYGTITKASVDGQKHLNISMKDLYVLMEGAFLAHNLAAYPVKKIERSMAIMKLTCTVYTSMMLRLLNKEYSLGNDMELHQIVTYCIGRFFLERVWGNDNTDVVNSYAVTNIRNAAAGRAINYATLNQVAEEYGLAEIKGLNQLVDFLKNLSPRLKTMNYRYIVQCWINMFKGSSIFAMEVLPYFLFTMQASLIGSFIVNQPIIMDICKNIKGVNNYYSELMKVIV